MLKIRTNYQSVNGGIYCVDSMKDSDRHTIYAVLQMEEEVPYLLATFPTLAKARVYLDLCLTDRRPY